MLPLAILNHWSEMWEAADDAPAAAAAQPLALLPAGAPRQLPAVGSCLDIFREGIGCDIHDVIASCCLDTAGGDASKPNIQKSEAAADIVRKLCGPLPRKLVPITAEAYEMGWDPKTWKERVIEHAAVGYFGSKAWAGSLCSHFARLCQPGGEWEAFSTATWVSFDETPLGFRTDDFQGKRSFPGLPAAAQTFLGLDHDVGALAHPSGKPSKQTCKIVQTDCAMSIREAFATSAFLSPSYPLSFGSGPGRVVAMRGDTLV